MFYPITTLGNLQYRQYRVHIAHVLLSVNVVSEILSLYQHSSHFCHKLALPLLSTYLIKEWEGLGAWLYQLYDALCIIYVIFSPSLSPRQVEREYRTPHSQPRLMGKKVQHMWSPSLYILCCLMEEGLINIGEIDPLNRRLSMLPKPDTLIQGTCLW